MRAIYNTTQSSYWLIEKLAKKFWTERGGKKRVENGMEKGWAVYARRGLNRGGTASWKGNIGARTMELWLV